MPVLVVMGVAGSGKSTVGRALAQRLGWVFGEGDDLHSAANVAKMARGEPLTDADRQPWLRAVRAWIDERVAAGEWGVITCSALRRGYRDELRASQVVFVYLRADEAVLRARLAARSGHFMSVAMLDSQLATLEPPGPDERTITVDVAAAGTPDAVERIVAALPADPGSPRRAQIGAEDSSQDTNPV